LKVGKSKKVALEKLSTPMQELVAAMKQIPLFSEEEEAMIITFAQAMSLKKCNVNDKVITGDADARSLYVVESGEFVETSRDNADQAATIKYSKGEAFGDLALRFDVQRFPAVKCTAKGAVYCLPVETLDDIFFASQLPPDAQSSRSTARSTARSVGSGAGDSASCHGYLHNKLQLFATELHNQLDEAQEKLDYLLSQRGVGGELGVLLLNQFRDMRTLEATIKSWDKDRDGTITMPEFLRELSALGVTAPQKDVEQLFKALDETHSGMVQLVKFKRRMLEIKESCTSTEVAITKQQQDVRVLQERCKLADDALHAEEVAREEEEGVLPIDMELSTDVRLWRLLQRNNVGTANKLMSLWDLNGDGVISKGEFRMNARKIGLLGSQKDIDYLYDKLDKDNDGWVDMPEAKAFIVDFEETVNEQVSSQQKATDARKETAADLRYRATVIAAALMAEAEVIQLEGRLKEVRKQISPEAKLAEVLLRKGTEASARILHSWSSNEGKQRLIYEANFAKGVKQLGMEITDEEASGIFKHFDPDGDGSIDTHELRKAVRQLQKAAEEATSLTAQANAELTEARGRSDVMREKMMQVLAAIAPRASGEADASEQRESTTDASTQPSNCDNADLAQSGDAETEQACVESVIDKIEAVELS